MTETVYTSAPVLRRPGAFLREAGRDLRRSLPGAWRLFRSDLRALHRRSILGYAWLLLPALAAAALCWLIQSSRVVAVRPTDLPYPLFVLAGVVLWQGFADALNAPLRQLLASRRLITRSRVPHEAVILAAGLSVTLSAAVRLVVLLAAALPLGLPLGPSALLLPLGMAALMLLGLAIGVAAAPFGLLYDDVPRALLLGTALWFFLTPVVYPLPTERWFRLNPVTPLLDTSRSWLLEGSMPAAFGIVVTAATAFLALAWLLYRLAQPHLIARLG